jgi:hypothetical protein
MRDAAVRLAATIEIASSDGLDDLLRLVWRGHADGVLTEEDAQTLDAAIRRRRGDDSHARRAGAVEGLSPASFKRRMRRVPSARERWIRHRRELGGCGAFPRQIAGYFPTAQQAVLTIISHEVRDHGQCDLHIQHIADRAKVSRSTIQNAIREARLLGLITVQARRLSPTKNLSNIVRIVSKEWRAWLKLDGRPVGGWGVNARNSSPQIRGSKQEEGRRGCRREGRIKAEAPS